MALSDDYTLANDATFRQKLRIAICSIALDVAGESPTSQNVVDEKRSALATAVLKDGAEAAVEAFSYPAVASGALTGQSTDQEIKNRLSAIWNDLAGVTGGDLQ